MDKKSLLLIVLSGILWGTSGIFFNLLTPYGFSPLQMTAMRGVVAAISMSVFLLISDRKCFRINKKEIFLVLGSGICMFLAAYFYYFAIKASSVSTAVILMYTAPVFVLAYAVAFLGEKLNIIKAFSIAFMIIGCALVSGVVGGIKLSFAGVALGLSAGITYSGYNIFTKIQMMHKVNSKTSSVYSFIVMALISLCFCNPPQMVQITAQKPLIIIPLIIGIGVCTCVLPYFLYSTALKKIPAGTATALGIIEPMAATVFSVAIFGEKLSVFSAIGIILILGSCVALSKSE